MLKPVLYIAIGAYLLLLAAVWLAPVEFTACTKDSLWCSFSYWITESAGKYGTVVIIFLAGIFYSLRFETWGKKALNFLKSVGAMIVFLALFAAVNEHLTKKATRIPRPCHRYVYSKISAPGIPIDSFYLQQKEEKHDYMSMLINSNGEAFRQFDKKILEHWIEEVGYSFPSGHSFNAFVLGCMLSFGLHTSRRKIAKYVWFLPLLWAPLVAISRVAIGAHSALDVSFGAGMGILVAMTFLYFDNTRKLIIHRKER